VAVAVGAPGAAAALRVGSVTLKRCAGARAWCGTLSRPLDPRRASGPRIRIGFKWIRALPGAARAPALVAVEGGPGHPSIGSEVEYRGIFGPVLRDRNLLLVDNRGTGRSALVDCPRLQRYPGVTTAARFPRLVAACAAPRRGELRRPGHVLRFRKERSFVYPLVASDEALASPPLEQIALAQVGLGEPSVVRFQLTPTPSYFEEIARRRYKRHENKLVRQERWGLAEGGLWSTLNRSEMRNAQRTQNRSLFWLEVQVAANSGQACKTIAAAVQSRRGENRLHRRWMTVRQGLYRRRFPRAVGPLIPSTRCLVSASEVAHLLALPSARMKGVPVRRLALPRIPMPPEIRRATESNPWWPPEPPAGAHATGVTGARSTTSTQEERDAGAAGAPR
jgi:hypothetical protein